MSEEPMIEVRCKWCGRPHQKPLYAYTSECPYDDCPGQDGKGKNKTLSWHVPPRPGQQYPESLAPGGLLEAHQTRITLEGFTLTELKEVIKKIRTLKADSPEKKVSISSPHTPDEILKDEKDNKLRDDLEKKGK